MTDAAGSDAADASELDDADELATAQAVLAHVVASLVDDLDAASTGEGRYLPRLTVRAGPSDMGRVIGKRGRRPGDPHGRPGRRGATAPTSRSSSRIERGRSYPRAAPTPAPPRGRAGHQAPRPPR